MGTKTALVALLLTVSALNPDCDALIEVEQNGDAFTVKFEGLTLLEHSPSSPLFSVGHGEFEAIYDLGNYLITDNITWKEALDQSAIFDLSGTYLIELSSSSNPDLGVVVTLTEPSLGDMEMEFDYDTFANVDVDRFWLSISPAEQGELSLPEHFWGGGEQYTYLNMAGREYPVWVREQGFGRNKSSALTQIVDRLYNAGGDYHTTYWPAMQFVSSRGYFFEMTFPTYSSMLFSDDPDTPHTMYWHRTPVLGEQCPFCKTRFVVRNSLLDIVKAVSPGMPKLPDWVHSGAIMGVQGGTDAMLGYLEQAQNNNVSVAAMWIQDWSGYIYTDFGRRVFWNWKWNETTYPGLDTTIQDLLSDDVRVLVYITAHLNIEGDVYQDAVDQDDYWLTTESGDRLVQDFGHFYVATCDIIRPDPGCNCENSARTFYKNMMKQNMIDLGIRGWMADFGEYTPTEARTKYPSDWWGDADHGEILHQIISEEWASLNQELLEETGMTNEIMYWMRAGGPRSKKYMSMSWAGDQAVDWTQSDGLKSSIIAALSLAMGGVGLSHSDIGGYTGSVGLGEVRSRELLLRWAEYSAFTPVMRTHEGNHPEANWQVYSDNATLLEFGRLTRMFAMLSKDYVKTAVALNSDEGVPVMRPLFLDFENDLQCYDQEYEYMYGSDLLVAPVTEPGLDMWDVYLPGDSQQKWVWLWDTEEVAQSGGNTVVVPAPMGLTPVFYKEGSQWTSLFSSIRDEFLIAF